MNKMTTEEIVKKWKNKISIDEVSDYSSIGEVIKMEELAQIAGGKPGNGWIATISGECNASGIGCNPFTGMFD
jgi:hypothetical protein